MLPEKAELLYKHDQDFRNHSIEFTKIKNETIIIRSLQTRSQNGRYLSQSAQRQKMKGGVRKGSTFLPEQTEAVA